ncbi:MAG: carbonic anhydrase [Solirubrobacteraceae bacterium]|jgi:carbonic anhydrase|nr:carbonic anhydrase [Solirubrobacteraceae bacterium]
MSATDELLQNSQDYAASFDKGGLSKPPGKKVAVVACMDARVNPYGILGLSEGDAHVISNAGGVITDDEIRSLSISQHLLGTEEVILIQHTDCGMLSFTDEDFKGQLEQATGQRPDWDVHTFTDLEQNVRDSLERVKASPFIPNKGSVRGFVYEVETGALREVT